jgi:hypothetical protein
MMFLTSRDFVQLLNSTHRKPWIIETSLPGNAERWVVYCLNGDQQVYLCSARERTRARGFASVGAAVAELRRACKAADAEILTAEVVL